MIEYLDAETRAGDIVLLWYGKNREPFPGIVLSRGADYRGEPRLSVYDLVQELRNENVPHSAIAEKHHWVQWCRKEEWSQPGHETAPDDQS